MSDTTDDLEYGIDLWDDRNFIDREAQWELGVHTTRTGEVVKIKDMDISHLANTIKHFHWLDTTPLKRELKKKLP